MLEQIAKLGCGLNRQAGLARTPGADQGNQAMDRVLDQIGLLRPGSPANKGVGNTGKWIANMQPGPGRFARGVQPGSLRFPDISVQNRLVQRRRLGLWADGQLVFRVWRQVSYWRINTDRSPISAGRLVMGRGRFH